MVTGYRKEPPGNLNGLETISQTEFDDKSFDILFYRGNIRLGLFQLSSDAEISILLLSAKERKPCKCILEIYTPWNKCVPSPKEKFQWLLLFDKSLPIAMWLLTANLVFIEKFPEEKKADRNGIWLIWQH